jgi:hypothetical protein
MEDRRGANARFALASNARTRQAAATRLRVRAKRAGAGEEHARRRAAAKAGALPAVRLSPHVDAAGVGTVLRKRKWQDRASEAPALLSDLAGLLSGGGPATVDRTGLTGRFNFVLDWGRYVDPTDDSMPALVQATAS